MEVSFEKAYAITSRELRQNQNEQFQENDTVKNVVVDFLDAFLNPAPGSNWGNVLATPACSSTFDDFISQSICSKDMAKQHIQEDLTEALKRNGCLSQPDWDSILDDFIGPCINEELGSVLGDFAQTTVETQRNAARNDCLDFRGE